MLLRARLDKECDRQNAGEVSWFVFVFLALKLLSREHQVTLIFLFRILIKLLNVIQENMRKHQFFKVRKKSENLHKVREILHSHPKTVKLSQGISFLASH